MATLGLIWRAIIGSATLQICLAALVLYGAWKVNNLYQRHVGASAVVATIEKKADANAQLSIDVRTDVAEGKRGTPDPNRTDRVRAR